MARARLSPSVAFLAAGRRIGSPSEVRGCFEEAFTRFKSTHAVIAGMYPQFGDQVSEGTALVRVFGARQGR